MSQKRLKREGNYRSVKQTASNLKHWEEGEGARVAGGNARLTSLSMVRNVYVSLTGNTKGFTAFSKKLMEGQPEARKEVNGKTQWHFSSDFLWEVFMAEEKFARIIEKRRVDSFEELAARLY